MQVILPSKGIFGKRSVDMRPATFNDLRAVHSMNAECEPLIKIQFVQLLCDNIDLSKITKYDLDYLYAVAALSISFNAVNVNTVCPHCGKKFSTEFKFYEKDIKTFDKKVKFPQVRKINKVDYSYYMLSGQNELDAIEYALAQDDFDIAYQDAVACFTFGKTLDDIDWVKSLDAAIFLSAFIFQQCCFHGFENSEHLECPNCKGKIFTRISIPSELIKINLVDMTTQYTQVSDRMSFDSFLNFTIPEFKVLIDTLNSEV